MMKLWSKDNTETSEQIEKFTVGRDNEFDSLLAEHDVTGTIAHVTMLQQAGLMEAKEAELALYAVTSNSMSSTRLSAYAPSHNPAEEGIAICR